MIALLYGPAALTRVARLAIDDIIRNGDQVLLMLREPPSPVPEPAADIRPAWIANRTNMNTATNHGARVVSRPTSRTTYAPRNARWSGHGPRSSQCPRPNLRIGAGFRSVAPPATPLDLEDVFARSSARFSDRWRPPLGP